MEKNFQNNQIEHIYIHIPFCIRKCAYCSFFSVGFSKSEVEKYITFLIKEIKTYLKIYSIKAKTVYFGGGTPSLLTHSYINKILSEFELASDAEITLEANPVTLSADYLKKLTLTRINRISVGVQSMIDDELKLLGRLHDSKTIKPVLTKIKNCGFSNYSIDLMYGLPNQNLESLKTSVQKFLEFNPPHISLYCLSLEQDVPLFKLVNQIPDDEIVSQMYDYICNELKKSGYNQYEISNFAKAGYESKHNLSYWNDKSYLGFGASAAGYINGIRYQNPSDLKSYYRNVQNNLLFPGKHELTEKEHIEEYLFLGLRKTEGIIISEFIKKFGREKFDFYYSKLAKYIRDGYLIKKEERIYLAPQAYFVSNSIFSDIL